MARTIAQVVTKTLEKLKVLESGGTPDASDVTLVTEAYEDYYKELRNRHLVSWGVADDIPSESVTPLVNLLAIQVADQFEVPEGVIQRLIALEDVNKARLAVNQAPDYVSEPIPADYF